MQELESGGKKYKRIPLYSLQMNGKTGKQFAWIAFYLMSPFAISLCVQMLRTSEATPWALSALLHWTRLIIRDVHMAQSYNSTYCTLHNSYTDLYNNLVSKYHEATPS